MTVDTPRLRRAFEAIDRVNAQDPRRVTVNGRSVAANLIYGQRMSEELMRFAPQASEALQIAARGQHIERWTIPRAAFPMTRTGYHQWRRTLQDHHAARLRELLAELGADEPLIARVADLVRKLNPREDAEVQVLEDVVCLVFLKHELDPFAEKYAEDEAKLADILAKTWRKMSPAGQAAALALPPPDRVLALLNRGLVRTEATRED